MRDCYCEQCKRFKERMTLRNKMEYEDQPIIKVDGRPVVLTWLPTPRFIKAYNGAAMHLWGMPRAFINARNILLVQGLIRTLPDGTIEQV